MDDDVQPVVLVASSPIVAHALNATRLVRASQALGAEVVWYAPASIQDHAARLVGPANVVVQDDAGDHAVIGGVFSSLASVRRLYRERLVGQAAHHFGRLAGIASSRGPCLVISDTLMLAAGMLAEAQGLGWVSFGDGPLVWPDPDVPPFGSGLPPMAGPAGRHRNRTVRRASNRILFGGALAELNSLRAEHGLWPLPDLLTAGVSRQAHLQGCVPALEHPRTRWPGFVHFVGALGPGPGLAPPLPERLRRGHRGRPLALVTQGTVRRDPRELVDPACRVLRHEGFEVLAAGTAPSGAPDRDVTAMPAVDLVDALPHVDLLVTNGGYTTLTMALAHGVPVVQCGATEEKADIGARLRRSGAGVSIPLVRAPQWALRHAVTTVLASARHRTAQQALAADFARLAGLGTCTQLLQPFLAPAPRAHPTGAS